jgi:GT2 family glycosyltransferase
VTANRPAISAVVASIGRPSAADTVASIGASAASAGLPIEIILVWQTPEDPPRVADDVILLPAFPVGQAYAQNRAIEAAQGEIIAFVDDDEVVHRDWARGLVTTFARPPHPAAVFGSVLPLDDRGHGYCRFDGSEDKIFRGRWVAPWFVGAGGNMAVSRGRLVELHGFNISFGPGAEALAGGDADLILRLLRAGDTLVWTPDVRVYHPSKTTEERLESRYPYAYAIGRLVRRHRDPTLAARYAKGFLDAAVRAASQREQRLRRELRASGRGFVAGLLRRPAPQPPTRFLEWMPLELREALGDEAIVPLRYGRRPDPHVVYRAGSAVLHLYANPSEQLARALWAREGIRRSVGNGIPTTRAVAHGVDSLWVLEDALPGNPPPVGHPETWLNRAAEWVAGLAGPPGRSLGETQWWRERWNELEQIAPLSLRPAVRQALEEVRNLPARHVHGDLSRKNMLLTATSVGAVDWETAWLEGPPGVDLLFLALTGRDNTPDDSVLSALVAGRDPNFAKLRSHIQRAGVPDEQLRPALLVALSIWAADERRRQAQLGAYDTVAAYGELLARWGPALL